MKTICKGLKYKIARKLCYLAIKLDNSGNCDFDRNGEQKFIQELFESKGFRLAKVIPEGLAISERLIKK